MNGLRRPHDEVQQSDISPILGTCSGVIIVFVDIIVLVMVIIIVIFISSRLTVKRAKKGATPRMMDILVSVKPACKRIEKVLSVSSIATLRRRGGMKVNATQAAISRPATTALMARRRGTDRLRGGNSFMVRPGEMSLETRPHFTVGGGEDRSGGECLNASVWKRTFVEVLTVFYKSSLELTTFGFVEILY